MNGLKMLSILAENKSPVKKWSFIIGSVLAFIGLPVLLLLLLGFAIFSSVPAVLWWSLLGLTIAVWITAIPLWVVD